MAERMEGKTDLLAALVDKMGITGQLTVYSLWTLCG